MSGSRCLLRAIECPGDFLVNSTRRVCDARGGDSKGVKTALPPFTRPSVCEKGTDAMASIPVTFFDAKEKMTALALRSIGSNDFAVIEDGHSVGRIRLARGRHREVWMWNCTVPHLRFPSGNAGSLEAAKAAFRQAWAKNKAEIGRRPWSRRRTRVNAVRFRWPQWLEFSGLPIHTCSELFGEHCKAFAFSARRVQSPIAVTVTAKRHRDLQRFSSSSEGKQHEQVFDEGKRCLQRVYVGDSGRHLVL